MATLPIRVALLAALALGTAVLGHQQPTPSDPGRGTIAGIVIDAASRQPVGSAIVRLNPSGYSPGLPNQPYPVSYLTTSDGRFEFRDIVAASYTITASKSGRNGAYGKLRPAGSNATVTLTAAQRIDGLEIRLWQNATISGSVIDERNRPMIGVTVQLINPAAVTSQPSPITAPIATTDDRGQYRMSNISPGQYFVCVPVQHSTNAPSDYMGTIAPPSFVQSPSGLIDEGGRFVIALYRFPIPPPTGPHGERWTYVTTYAPNVTRYGLAQPLDLRVGDDRSGVDIQLTPVRSFRVSGQILGGDEKDAVVHIALRGDEPTNDLAAAQMSATDQTLLLMDVPEGDYTLEATRSFGRSDVIMPDAAGLFARGPIAVHDRDITDLVVTMRAGSPVSGRVEFDEPPASNVRFSIYLREFTSTWYAASSAAEVLDGKVNFNAVRPGRYQVSAGVTGPRQQSPVQSWTIKTATVDGHDVADRLLDVGESGVSDLVITMTARQTRLSGHVDDRGVPARGASVVVFPVDPDDRVAYGPFTRRVRTARPDLTGRYEFKGLPPGDYYLAALDEAAMDGWPRAPFLQSLTAAAMLVHLIDGDTRVVDLHVGNRR